MFGFGRKPGAGAVTARGEITRVDFGQQSVDSHGNTVAAQFTVGVRVFPDSAASFDTVLSVKLKGTAAPMLGEETWVRYNPRSPEKIEFDRERIRVRSYERVLENPVLKAIVDTVYAHGDPPITVFASAR